LPGAFENSCGFAAHTRDSRDSPHRRRAPLVPQTSLVGLNPPARCEMVRGDSGGMNCRIGRRRGTYEASAGNGDGGFDSARSVRGCPGADRGRRQLGRCAGTGPGFGAMRGCLVGDPGRPSRRRGAEVGGVRWTHRDVPRRIRADELRPLLAGSGRDRKRLRRTREASRSGGLRQSSGMMRHTDGSRRNAR